MNFARSINAIRVVYGILYTVYRVASVRDSLERERNPLPNREGRY